MQRILIIADDLTGAADSGVQLARTGQRTLLVLDASSANEDFTTGGPAEPDVLVLTSESRGLADGAQAAQAVSHTLAAFSPALFKNSPRRTHSRNDIPQNAPAPHFANSVFSPVYKKIDSTLRGHPAAELAAVMSALGEKRALIAPAFPAQGRTTLNGRVMINGQPLEQTSFSSEAPSGDLRRVFGAEANLLALETIRGEAAGLQARLHGSQGLTIADAETEDDLLRLARAALEEDLRLWCGSAGLAGALAACLGSKAAGAEMTRPLPHPAGSFLAVAGSRHAATAAQVAAAQQAGAVVVTPTADFFDAPQAQGMAGCAQRLADALAKGQDAILSVHPTEFTNDYGTVQAPDGYTQYKSSISPAEIAARLAQTAALALENNTPAGLFLTGGETARAVCRALGCTRLWLGGEVEPGMPWSRMADGRFPGLVVVTKAGGFGRAESLARALRF